MIVAGELMVRITRDRDLPVHYEAAPLKPAARAVGWPAGILTNVAGIAIYVGAGSVVAEAVGAILVLIGVAIVVALIRCRLFEVTVGERITRLQLGPFRRTLPTGCVTDSVERPASSWRRFYAPRELVISLNVDTRALIVPTHDPEELNSALAVHDIGNGDGDGQGDGAPTRAGDCETEIRNSNSELTLLP